MTLPGVVEGCIGQPGEADVIRVKIEKAQDIAFEIETPEATLPRFNPVVRLLEPGGREIATDVYTKLNNNGLYMMKMIRAKTTLSIGAPGEYTMQIRDITTDCARAGFSLSRAGAAADSARGQCRDRAGSCEPASRQRAGRSPCPSIAKKASADT